MKKAATKEMIGETLCRLCETLPFAKISVQKITQEVGINRQTFYYHFTGKEALLVWVYEKGALHYLDAETLSLENWEEHALKMLKGIAEQAAFYQNTVAAQPELLTQVFSKKIRRLFIHLFQNIDQENELSQEDQQFYGRFFAYGCSGVLIDWIRAGFKETPLKISMQLFRLAKDVEFFSYRLYEQEQASEEN